MDSLSRALAHAANGWFVVPCLGKVPIGTDWPKRATRDADTIRQAWADHPSANVGIVPGLSNKTVIDIDDHDGSTNGFETAEVMGLTTEATVQGVSSGGKGQHLWFDGASTNGKPYPGIDRKSVNGVVVLGNYDLPHVATVTELLPTEYALSIPGGQTRLFDGSVNDWLASYTGMPTTPKVAAKRDWLAKGEAITGHDSMLRLQKEVVMYAAEGEGGVPELLDAMRTRWVDSPHTPGEDIDLEWDRALATAIANFGGDVVKPGDGDIADNPLQFKSVSDLRRMTDPAWLVDGLIQESTVSMIAGPGNVGKSFVALDWALSVALGQPWKGHAVTQAPVLYVAAEGMPSFKKRIAAWEVENQAVADDAPIHFLGSGFNLGDAESVAYFKQYVEFFGADLIILDTLSQLSDVSDENDAAQASGALKVARAIREVRPKATVLIVHHATKGGSSGFRGSSAYRDNVDTLIVAKHSSGKSGKFKLTTDSSDDGKVRDGEPVTVENLIIRSVDGTGSAAVFVESSESHTLALIRSVFNDKPTAKMSDFFDAYEASPDPEDDERPNDDTLGARFRRELKKMTDAGYVTKVGNSYRFGNTRVELAA